MNILEYSANPTAHAAREGSAKRAYDNVLLAGCVLPFLNGFIPANKREEGLVSGPGLGLILSRDTADMLADADPPVADPWRRRVFGPKPDGGGLGAVYVDIPHGALRLGKTLQLRALFAIPWRAAVDDADPDSEVAQTGSVLVASVVTEQGSDQPLGLLFAVEDEEDCVRVVTMPDASVTGFITANEEQLGDTAKADTTELYALLYQRTVAFFRLVLAYHHYGPLSARNKVAITSVSRFTRNNNRPRAGESIFAMERLVAPPDRLGRSRPRNSHAGWVVTLRQEVAGHFKLQPHGPGHTQRRLIWVDSYHRGPEDAPIKPRGFRF
jgi:hypothetical protein